MIIFQSKLIKSLVSSQIFPKKLILKMLKNKYLKANAIGRRMTKKTIRMEITSSRSKMRIRMAFFITKIVLLKVNKKKNRIAIVPVEKSLLKLGFSLELRTRSSSTTTIINMTMEQLVDSWKTNLLLEQLLRITTSFLRVTSKSKSRRIWRSKRSRPWSRPTTAISTRS